MADLQTMKDDKDIYEDLIKTYTGLVTKLTKKLTKTKIGRAHV